MYGLLIGVTSIIAILAAEKLINIKKLPISKNEFWNLIIIIFFLSVFGGRAYHCLDNYQYYFLNPIKIFYLWQGGFGIFGSVLLVTIFLFIYSKAKSKSFYIYTDTLLLFTPFLIIAGRVGNIFNNELKASVIEINIFGILVTLNFIFLEKLKITKGYITSIFLVIYGFVRIIEELGRNPSNTFVYNGINLTYVFSVFMMLAGFGIMVSNRIKNKFNS